MPASTGRTITDPQELTAELARVRARGYAVDDEEQEQGVRCAAVVVPGVPATAISVSAPAGRLTRSAVRRIVPVLRETAADLAGGLGRAHPEF